VSDRTNVVKVEVDCPTCHASGIYRGLTTPPLIGEVCKKCKGTGKEVFEYTPFTGRKIREGIQVVCRDSYGKPIGERTGREDITYLRFLAGEFPPNNCRA